MHLMLHICTSAHEVIPLRCQWLIITSHKQHTGINRQRLIGTLSLPLSIQRPCGRPHPPIRPYLWPRMWTVSPPTRTAWGREPSMCGGLSMMEACWCCCPSCSDNTRLVCVCVCVCVWVVIFSKKKTWICFIPPFIFRVPLWYIFLLLQLSISFPSPSCPPPCPAADHWSIHPLLTEGLTLFFPSHLLLW